MEEEIILELEIEKNPVTPGFLIYGINLFELSISESLNK